MSSGGVEKSKSSGGDIKSWLRNTERCLDMLIPLQT